MLIFDNGSYSIKTIDRTFPNAIFRAKNTQYYVSSDVFKSCPDYTGIHVNHPFEKEFLTNWQIEKAIWDHVLALLGIESSRVDKFIVTEPALNLPILQEQCDRMSLEGYQFQSISRLPACVLATHALPAFYGKALPELALVVDAGHHCTTIAPVYKGRVVADAVKRLGIGGVTLTNYLKELISFRQWYVMDQTLLVEKIKHECCYVAPHFDIAKLSIDPVSYVLPDYDPKKSSAGTKLGHVLLKPDEIVYEQVATLTTERVIVPEVLFTPAVIESTDAGLVEAIHASASLFSPLIQGLLYSNIITVGGTASLPGFADRIRTDLRSLVPDDLNIEVYSDSDPATTVVRAAAARAHELPFTSQKAYSKPESHITMLADVHSDIGL